MQELISIIVPVYNAEPYLRQCLDSILGQTYRNIEVICVDDSSTDGSLHILEEYSIKDNRLVVSSKSNEGVSKARNYGMNQANGKFIMFVDADDWINKDTCEIAYNMMVESNVDVVMWAYVSEFENRSAAKIIYPNIKLFNDVYEKQELHRRFIGIIGDELGSPEKADSLCSVWGKLYRKKIILDNGINFIDLSEIGTYEDGMFNMHFFYYINSALYIPEPLYHYRRTNGNSQTSYYREKLPMQWDHLFDLMDIYIREKQLGEDYKVALNNRIALSIMGLGLNISMSKYSVKKKCVLIRNVIMTERYKKASAQLKMRYFPLHWRFFYGAAKKGCAVAVYFLLVVIRKIIYG